VVDFVVEVVLYYHFGVFRSKKLAFSVYFFLSLQ